MEKFRIRGGIPLKGTVTISGAKNAAVAILPAALLTEDVCVIENLPYIDDVLLLRDILVELGVEAKFETVNAGEPSKLTIRPTVKDYKVDFDAVRKMRASYYFMGALLSRCGTAEVALPGGCDIGTRPIDLHIKGFEALGATVINDHGIVKATAPEGGLVGAEVYLDIASVGATINIMLASVRAKGQTTIVNAAKEPHIVDVANYLNCMGASIKGAGTDVIRIKGVEKLHGCTYAIIPDQIEAGTYMIAAAATRGDVTIRNVIPIHLEAISAKLMEMGVNVIEGDDGHEFFIRIINERPRCRSVRVKTQPYPGFPTDLQQPLMSMATTCEGTSMLVESIWEDRFRQVPYLRRMGADINVTGTAALVTGKETLMGCPVVATDLRAGAALIIAGLMANGETEISDIQYIDRGYEQIETKLRLLGADIDRITTKDED